MLRETGAGVVRMTLARAARAGARRITVGCGRHASLHGAGLSSTSERHQGEHLHLGVLFISSCPNYPLREHSLASCGEGTPGAIDRWGRTARLHATVEIVRARARSRSGPPRSRVHMSRRCASATSPHVEPPGTLAACGRGLRRGAVARTVRLQPP